MGAASPPLSVTDPEERQTVVVGSIHQTMDGSALVAANHRQPQLWVQVPRVAAIARGMQAPAYIANWWHHRHAECHPWLATPLSWRPGMTGPGTGLPYCSCAPQHGCA